LQKWIFDIRSGTFFLFLLIFVILSILVYTKITEQFDESIILFFQSIAGNNLLDYSMWIFTEIGGIFPIIGFSFFLLIRRKTRRIGLVIILSVLIGTIASGYLKDFVIVRARPDLDFLGTEFPIDIESDTSTLGGKGSFPSGHVTRAASITFVVGYVLSERFPRGCYLLWLFPLIMAISRIYVLQHYPMDVIGGIIFGILIANILAKKLKLSEIFEKSKI